MFAERIQTIQFNAAVSWPRSEETEIKEVIRCPAGRDDAPSRLMGNPSKSCTEHLSFYVTLP
jgi:hypothetical protein